MTHGEREHDSAWRRISVDAQAEAAESGEAAALEFSDLFPIEQIQEIQDAFSAATGVASLITKPDGTPITRPSNFCRLCDDVIRGTEKGLANCKISDAVIGRPNASGPLVQTCLSGGLWDAGASITAGGEHIANWLVGQVRNEAQDPALMLAYADEIGADRDVFLAALEEVPAMSVERFGLIARSLFLVANELSFAAYQTLEQKRLVAEGVRAQEAIRESRHLLTAILDAVPQSIFLKDSEGRYLGCNARFAQNAGLESPDEVIGKTDFDLCWADAAEAYRQDDAEVMSSGKAKTHIIEQLPAADGTVFWVDTTKVPLIDESAAPYAVLGVFDDITDRKRAEEALTEGAERSRAILQAALDGFALLDTSGRLLEVNDAFCTMTGFDSDELLTLSVADLADPDSAAEVAERIAGIVDEGSARFETRTRRKDGTTFDVEVSIRYLDTEGGRLAAFVHDITQRRAADTALRNSYEMLFNLTDQVPGVVYQYQLDPDGSSRFPFASRGMNDIYEYSPEEVRQDATPVFGRLHPDDYDRVAADIAESARTLGPFHSEFRVILPRQGLRWRLSDALPQRLENGGTLWYGIISDITERLQSEMKVAEYRDRLDLALQAARMGVWQYDVVRDLLTFDEQVCKLFGIDPATFTGTTAEFLDAIHPEDVPVVEAALSRSLHDGELYRPEYRTVWPDGTVRWLTARGSVTRDAAGEPVLMNGVLWDITERKRAEQDLRASEERLNRAQHHAHIGSWTWDIKSNRLDWSDEMFNLFGVDKETFTGSPPDVIAATIHPEDRERVDATNAGIIAGANPVPIDYRIVLPDGSVRVVWAEAGDLILDDEGKPSQLSGTVRDITEEKALRDAVARQAERIARTLTSVIDIASTIVETRDPYTAGHQKRVADIACRVAEEIGMSDLDIVDIRLASLIHDIGKVQVPSEILGKPGPISPIEYEILKTHAEAGYRIVASANMQDPIAEMVYQHHERCDGSGYPRGLTGDDMLTGAKVIAVADVVEAMMSHRPYRPAVGIEAALAEVERGAGTVYDPLVAKTCVDLFRDQGFTVE